MKGQVKSIFLLKDIIILAVIFTVGIACCFFGDVWKGLGIIIILCGAMTVPFYHHGYKLEGQKGHFELKEILIPKDNKNEIIDFLDGKTDILELNSWQTGGALVDVYYRKSDGYMMARYFDYADHMNGIEHPLREITTQQLKQLDSEA